MGAMQTPFTAPDILHAFAAIFSDPTVQIIVALIAPILLVVLEAYFRTRGKPVARDADAAFASDPALSSAWRDAEQAYSNLFETYSRGRRRENFRVNRKSDWRFDQRRHAAADANRDIDTLFGSFHKAQRIARRRFAFWKLQVAGARAADAGGVAYCVALAASLLLLGVAAAFATASGVALTIAATMWIGYAGMLTPGEYRRIVHTDIGWEALAGAYEASEDGAEF